MDDKLMVQRWLGNVDLETQSHMLVVCDTFDYETYPKYVKKEEAVLDVISNYSKNMQRVMEVYDLSKDFDEQINSNRAWNI